MITILGAGLAGLSTAYHIGHDECVIYEKNQYATGHIHSEYIDGFTWDEGPHVSFTENTYVKEFFQKSLNDDFLEYPVKTANYFKGNWIPHPAQSNLFAIPQPLRDECLSEFLKTREFYPDDFVPTNYQQWLEFSFGTVFTENFPAAYTRKYWTTSPENLTTDWVGGRVFFPKVEQVKEGYYAALKEQTHYIKKVRYPNKGGYMSFASKLLERANLKLGYELSHIDFETKTIEFKNGEKVNFDKLINTIPLPILIAKSNAPDNIKKTAEKLACSSVFLVNVTASHTTVKEENWIYVYDEDKYSTRINCTELLSPNNAPAGKTGIQVEVYFSNYRAKTEDDEFIAEKVINELLEMGLIKSREDVENYHTKSVQWANVIFDKGREVYQNEIIHWLSQYGLIREDDDLEPMTNWNEKFNERKRLGDIILSGRFGQWKYFWTDDCVLRGKYIAENLTL